MRGGVVSNAYRDIYDINFYWIYWRNDTRLVEGNCFVCVWFYNAREDAYILMANENDYHKCVMIMDVLKLSAA